MQINDKLFVPNQGMGRFSFDLNEKNLVDILEFSNIKYEKEIKEYVIEYILMSEIDNTSIFFHYENSSIDYISIHTSDLILNNINIGKESKYEELLPLIKEYHNKNNIQFKYTTSQVFDELFIYFENIGLSIWFENHRVSDICITSIEN